MKEIVIKIPDNIFSQVKQGRYAEFSRTVVGEAIKNGTELPKGHDRLIYANEELYQSIRAWVGVAMATEILEKAPTIIEADKEYEVEVVARGKCMMCGKELTDGLFFCRECEAKQVAEKGDE